MTEKFELMSEDFLINMLETQKAEKAKVNELEIVSTNHERRIFELETNVPINPALNNYLTKLRRGKVVEALGGKSSKAYHYVNPEGSHYKKLSNECFAEAERRFKNDFGLRNYGELKQHQYEEAVIYWNDFELSDKLQRKINEVNNQIELNLINR